jgi:hypothetical protein
MAKKAKKASLKEKFDAAYVKMRKDKSASKSSCGCGGKGCSKCDCGK